MIGLIAALALGEAITLGGEGHTNVRLPELIACCESLESRASSSSENVAVAYEYGDDERPLASNKRVEIVLVQHRAVQTLQKGVATTQHHFGDSL